MFVSFINVFDTNSEGYRWLSRTLHDLFTSFYAKPALFIELHLTLQTDFMAHCCFGFLPMTSIEQICPSPLLYRDLLSAAWRQKNVR